jgi:hypothetical protein
MHHQKLKIKFIAQSGYFMVGLSIVLLAAALATIGTSSIALGKFKESIGTGIGNQLQNTNTALAAYILNNNSNLVSNTAITGFANIYKPTISELVASGFLNSNTQQTPTSGGSYVINISLTPSGCTTSCTAVGYVYLSNPIVAPDGKTSDIKLLVAAANSSTSGQIGFSMFQNPSIISGQGWTEPNPDPDKRAGILYATTGFSSSKITQYWLKPASSFATLPLAGNSDGDGRIVLDTGKPYRWKASSARWVEFFADDTNVSIGINSGSPTTGYYNVFNGYFAGRFNTTGRDNSFIGAFSGRSNTEGSSNVFIGGGSGSSNTTGSSNVFSGVNSGIYNRTGVYNTFNGNSSGFYNSTGNYNTFNGYQSGASNIEGGFNVFNGAFSGYSNKSSDNVFNGVYSGYSNTTGYGNTLNGTYSGKYNTTGYYNVFNGTMSGYQNTTGAFNVFNGAYSGHNNSTGIGNVFNGYYSGLNNTTGTNNTFNGAYSGKTNTTGSINVFNGNYSGYSNTTASGNTFNGYSSGYANTIGNSNVFSGVMSGYNNTTGYNNVFNGAYSGLNNTTASENTFNGHYSGNSNTTGASNTFNGKSSGISNTTGGRNVFNGVHSGSNNTIGNGNVFHGALSGYDNIDGSNNVVIGFSAGKSNTNGSKNVYIGAFTGYDGNYVNSIALGSNVLSRGSNTASIGDGAITSIGGAVGWSNLSDRRLKENVKNSERGLSFIRKIRPVDYTLISNKKSSSGFIAQEIEAIDPTFPGLNKPVSDSDFYSLTYTDFIPSIVKSIQELDARTPVSSDTFGAAMGSEFRQIVYAIFVFLFGIIGWLIHQNLTIRKEFNDLKFSFLKTTSNGVA